MGSKILGICYGDFWNDVPANGNTKGKIVFEQGDGLIELSTRTAPNGQTHFQIGSLTKQFVAAAILVLVDQGKLDLAAKIGRYMPNLAKPVGDLTIHQLLSNTSGIAPAPFAEGASEQLLGPANRAELLATFVEKPLRFKPGSKFEYSNSGFLLLGVLIERITRILTFRRHLRIPQLSIESPQQPNHCGDPEQ